MSVFGHYARFYDLLNADKPYAHEAKFVHHLLQEFGDGVHGLLDVGCGTGAHALEFVRLGYAVTGLDQSERMIGLAEERRSRLPEEEQAGLRFETGSIQAYRSQRPFDAVTALFHVMSYQASDAQLSQAIEAAACNLAAGGLFVFDFWHGPGVLNDEPESRTRKVEDEVISATRTSYPRHDPERRLVEVEFVLDIEERATGRTRRITETHLMRYFGLPEIEAALAAGGFAVVSAGKWLDRMPPGKRDWYACVVARKH